MDNVQNFLQQYHIMNKAAVGVAIVRTREPFRALSALRDRGWCAPDAVTVVEIALDDPWEAPAFAEALEDRAYGDTRVLFLRIGGPTPP